jgi:ketosteroid isomerase-like protein
MRRRLLLLFMLASATALPVAPAEDVQGELRALETKRSAAIKAGDLMTLDAIYADDFKGVAGSGKVVGKADLMEVFKHQDPRVAFTVDEMAVRVLGDAGIVTARLVGKTADGKVVSDARLVHVYARRDGAWKFVFGQATPVQAS